MDTEEKREEGGNRKASQSSYSGSSGNGEAERTKGMFQKKNHELVRDGLKDLELERVWRMAGPMEQGHIHQWHLPHRLVCPAPH